MKKRLAAIICLLIIMGILPLAVVRISGENKGITNASTPDSIQAQNKSSDISEVCAYAEKLCREDFCDEAIKAAVIIANTNYDIDDNKENNNSNSELLKRIESVYNSNKELYIAYDGEKRFIPYSYCSNGSTVKSEDYEYIKSAASPWDCYCDEYSPDLTCEGVSMYGVNYLCENGFSAEEALKWYLNGSEVGILQNT